MSVRNLKKQSVKLLIVLCTSCLSMSISAEVSSIYNTKTYENILDIHCTPFSYDDFTGGFSDQGSWMCFTLPSNDNWVNGFCGPFELDRRQWVSNAILQVGFTPDIKTEQFVPNNTTYNPGELFISSDSDLGNIQQKLFFIDKYTALWSCETNEQRNLYITIGTLRGIKTSELENNSWIMKTSTGETYIIAFQSGIQISYENSKFQAIVPAGIKGYATISYLYENKQPINYLESLQNILSHPDTYETKHTERWLHYLKSTLRTDMPYEYNRIAVKSIVTLLTNWRASRGDLLHDGVIPSHAMDYFIGFWGWDSWKHAVALAGFAPDLAKNQVRAMFDYQTQEGMVIDCIYTNKRENNTRDSKPPLAAWAVNEIYKATADIGFVKEIYPKLLKYYRWWYQYRDHDRNGICEFGSVDGTLEAAAWESGMDNAIRFDHASMVKNQKGAWSLNQESVDLNAYLAYEYTLLKELAQVSGNEFTEQDRSTNVANYFFHTEKGFFYDKKLSDHSFVTVEGCEAYIPFWAKIATVEQAEQAMKYFTDSAKFGTYIPFPTVTADHPKFSSNGYWRGPIWLDQVYFGIRGIRNYGYNELADNYTKQVFDRLNGLIGDAPIHENYDTNTGSRLKSPNFSWSAAHLLMLYEECGTLEYEKTDLCLPDAAHRNFVYIKNVEFAGIHNEVAYSKTDWIDYSNSFIAEIELSKTYTMDVTVANWDSGSSDQYKLRLWIDWNGNYQLEKDELIDTKQIDAIGNTRTEHKLQFTVTVPQNAVTGKNLKFRLFLHFVENESDGEEPCGNVDSGIVHDYGFKVKSDDTSINHQNIKALVFPNPVSDNLYIENGEQIKEYTLYGMGGSLLFRHVGHIEKIDMSSFPRGSYLLRMDFGEGELEKSEYYKIIVQ